jgi:hypothetical protein
MLSLQLLPQIVVEDKEILMLTSGQDESRWDDPKLDVALRQYLQMGVERRYPLTSSQSSYDVFLAKLRAIRYALVALERELQNARSFLHDEAGLLSEVCQSYGIPMILFGLLVIYYRPNE